MYGGGGEAWSLESLGVPPTKEFRWRKVCRRWCQRFHHKTCANYSQVNNNAVILHTEEPSAFPRNVEVSANPFAMNTTINSFSLSL